jgi:hypothetical protein
MAIFKRNELQRHLDEFTARYEKLKAVAGGSKPNANIYDQYSNDAKQYETDFVEVNLIDLDYALNDFNSAIKTFKSIHKLTAPKLGKTR